MDEDTVNIVGGVADAANNQAEAGTDASITDRVKMASGDGAGMVSNITDDPYISVS